MNNTEEYLKAINVTLEFDRYSHHSVVNACIHVQMWTDFAGAVIAAADSCNKIYYGSLQIR